MTDKNGDLPRPPDVPDRGVTPQYAFFEAGRFLSRIYAPESYLEPWPHTIGPKTFRRFGPIERFDHHAVADPPAPDASHGIYYAGVDIWDCAVEVFWRTRIIRLASNRFAALLVTRDLLLMDLDREGAIRIGATAGLSKGGTRTRTQEWARHIHSHPDFYASDGRPVDGLLYTNSHNEGSAVALFERAEGCLSVDTDRALKCDTLRTALELCAARVPALSIEP